MIKFKVFIITVYATDCNLEFASAHDTQNDAIAAIKNSKDKRQKIVVDYSNSLQTQAGLIGKIVYVDGVEE